MRGRLPRQAGPFVFVFFGILLSSASSASAQAVVQVDYRLSKDKVHPGDVFKVALLVNIAPGYHVNGTELVDPYLIPTQLTLKDQPGLKIEEYVFPRPEKSRFAYSKSEIEIYQGEIVIGALVLAANDLSLGTHKLSGRLIYQACDSESCLNPADVNLEILVDVVSPSRPTKDINRELFSKLEFQKDKKR